MKVNGNKKNGKSVDSKESNMDKISKAAVALLDEIPLKHFDTSKTWEKIYNKLSNVDKRFVTWGLAMAASFSLLVAANIEIFNWKTLKEESVQELIVEVQDIKIKELNMIPLQPTSLVHLEKIQVSIPAGKAETPILNQEISNESKTILLLNKDEHQHIEISRLSNPFVSVFAKANFQTDGIAPEIGIDLKIAENYTAKRREIYKVGISSQFNYKTNEAGNKSIHPNTFVNLEFTSLNKKTNKGWTTRAGYLLNPNEQLYQDTTIKVSFFRNISKHIKIGPEVIFTDNMKKAYPSISLVLG